MTRYSKKEEGLIRLISKTLMEDWDPIGVKEFQEAWDEYDTYAESLYRMLNEKKSSEEIFQYLRWVETEHMGLECSKETKAVAETLCSLVYRETKETIISLNDVKNKFLDLLNDKVSREEADRWAYSVIKQDDSGDLIFFPSSDRENILRELMYLYGVDLQDSPGHYLHSKEDINNALHEKIEKFS
jgi:hypothetical protein